ncbi:uncharacterized protein LOC133179199 [Saccostrea echinata]|uniref:uncharacterized protein LOC133179199 n=1 Tax=Saccostrea echinata TaxID=191078 RepID=UPI002A7F865C|nr:uncharacterized protein LOC133179199 [Saccostrea echinata]
MEADQAGKGHFSKMPLQLFITTASELPVNVQVQAPMVKDLYQGDNFMVKKGIIKQVSIPKSLRSQETERAKKAIHVVASDEIVVFGINQAHLSTDGFLGIPLDVLGTKYFVPSFISTAEHFFQSAILIVGTQDRTMLNIKLPLKNNIDIQLEGKSYNRGDWINITINKFDTLQLRCHADLTGTLVLSSQKVSVFGGSTVTSIGVGISRDHIEEQIPPINVWGKRFAVNSFPDTNPNILRFLASEDDTTVNINDKETVHIMAGNFHETHIDSFSFITSNKPILSIQYVPSGTCHRDDLKPGCHKGDPAMTLIPPTEQSNMFYSFLTPVSSQNSNFSNIFMFVIEDSRENGILLDKRALRRSELHSVVRNHNLTAGYFQVPPGSHTIEHSLKNLPFGGVLYGGIKYESYAFPVGQRFATINKKECRPLVMYIGDGVDNDCDGQVDEEICNDLQDNDMDGQTDEDCLKALSTTTKSTPSTTTPPRTTPTPTSTTTFKSSTSTETDPSVPSKTTTKTPSPTATTTTASNTTSTVTPITTIKTTLKPVVTTLSSILQQTQMSEEPQRPAWFTYTEYGIIGGVSVVVIGAIGVCCKKCLGLLGKRDDDEDEEEYRRKVYKKARQAFGTPSIRPMYINIRKT